MTFGIKETFGRRRKRVREKMDIEKRLKEAELEGIQKRNELLATEIELQKTMIEREKLSLELDKLELEREKKKESIEQDKYTLGEDQPG